MLVRVVRMEFDPAKVDAFKQLFYERKEKISGFPGCQQVQLLQDHIQPNVYYTLSHWNGPDDLENYRTSPFFEDTWKATKALFSGKPKAWSLIPDE